MSGRCERTGRAERGQPADLDICGSLEVELQTLRHHAAVTIASAGAIQSSDHESPPRNTMGRSSESPDSRVHSDIIWPRAMRKV